MYWRIHDAYFAQRGVRAWLDGDIPFLSTSNRGIARQHASYVLAHLRGQARRGLLDAEAPCYLLEIGGGAGTFAAHFLAALDEAAADEPSRRLARNVRYVLSDYAARTVRDAAAGPELRELVAAGRVIPALFDAREPHVIRAVDGAPLRLEIAVVLANYLCCVLPTRFFQKVGAEWRELFVWTSAELAAPPAGQVPAIDAMLEGWLAAATSPGILAALENHFEWREVELAGAVTDPLHRRILERHLDGVEHGTVGLPVGFFDCLAGAAAWLSRGAAVIVTDFGGVDRDRRVGLRDPSPKLYGNTVNHAVDFTLLDGFAEAAGWAIRRTTEPMQSLHTAVLSGEPDGGAPDDDFAAAYVARRDGQDVLDFSAAAQSFHEAGDFARARRFLDRCVEVGGDQASFQLRLGEACLGAAHFAKAIEHLERGAALDRWGASDFDFHLARAHVGLRDFAAAIPCYRRSLARRPDTATHTSLGSVYEAVGDLRGACREYLRALDLAPDNETAAARLAVLKPGWQDEPETSREADDEPR